MCLYKCFTDVSSRHKNISTVQGDIGSTQINNVVKRSTGLFIVTGRKSVCAKVKVCLLLLVLIPFKNILCLEDSIQVLAVDLPQKIIHLSVYKEHVM